MNPVVDSSGRSIMLCKHEDLYYSPQFSKQAMEEMTNFTFRKDDVLLVTYPKSGCHWAWEILRILVTGDIENKNLIDKQEYMLEWRVEADMAALPSPRVLNNHAPFSRQPKDLLVTKPKVVFFYRNLKDVAVSFFYHHSGIPDYQYQGDDFNSYVHRMVDGLVECGNPFKYHREWDEAIRNHPELSVYPCSYEDMKKDPVSEMRRVSEFLGKCYDDTFLNNVCTKTNFNFMKETKGKALPVFYRKGQVGDWKNHFTVSMNEWFDDLIQKEMPDVKFNYRYTLD